MTCVGDLAVRPLLKPLYQNEIVLVNGPKIVTHLTHEMNDEYYTSPDRRCKFSIDYVTPGEQGLAWAILLKAVEDGCSEEWLRDIVRYYRIDFDVSLFHRMPVNRIKMNSKTNEMIGIHFEAPRTKKCLLSLHDGLHLRGLEHIA